MKKALGHIGTLAFLLQIASVCIFCILLNNERHDPGWRPGALLSRWQGDMLGAVMYALGASGVIAFFGLVFQGSRMPAGISLVLLIPIVLVLGAFQGSS